MDMYLTQVDVQYSEDDGQRELGSVEGEEPLGGVHVRLYPVVLHVLMQVWQILLQGQHIMEMDGQLGEHMFVWKKTKQ